MFGHVVGAAELKTVPLFASLDEEELRELASWFDEQACSEGVCLTGDGASGYSFYVLVDGNAEVTAEGQELATLGPGDFFGEDPCHVRHRVQAAPAGAARYRRPHRGRDAAAT
jgi:CRP/FNR family transcriptional regulator, cyclic AMP receptor protein